MSWGEFFTIDEVIEATGFDRRTIAYYVQQGLLPKVGRRGRLTRYPQKMVDRLLFIKLLRDAEESGERPVPMTLAEIGDALDRIPAKRLHVVAAGHQPLSAVERYLRPPDEASAEPAASGPLPERWEAHLNAPPDLVPQAPRVGLVLDETGDPELFILRTRPDAAIRESRFMLPRDAPLDKDNEPEVHACMGPPTTYDEEPVEDASQDDLEALMTQLCRLTAHQPPRRGSAESWSRVAVTPGLELAARGDDRSTRNLLERIAKLLRNGFIDSLDRSRR